MKKVEQVEVEYIKKTSALLIAVACLVLGFAIGLGYSKLSPSTEKKPAVSSASPPQSGSQNVSTPPAAPAQNTQKMAEIMRLKQIVGADPNNAEAWAQLGHNYFDLHQHTDAIDAYKKYLEINPNNANVWTDLGVMYRRTRSPQEAVRCFDKAVEIDPNHQQSRFNKGIVLMFDLHKHEEGLNSWRDLLKVNPNATAPDGTPISQLLQQYATPPAK